MIIRWVGAYGKAESLEEALAWELSQTTRLEVAACPMHRGSDVPHCSVGLLIARKALRRKHSGDVWSEYTAEGTLMGTRKPRKSGHGEAFVAPRYTGIVVRWGFLSEQAKKAVASQARLHKLPVLAIWWHDDKQKPTLKEVDLRWLHF